MAQASDGAVDLDEVDHKHFTHGHAHTQLRAGSSQLAHRHLTARSKYTRILTLFTRLIEQLRLMLIEPVVQVA